MKIEQIQIHNVRCINDMTLKLDDYLLLVGANNSGKSTVIHALRLFFGDVKWNEEKDSPLQGKSQKDLCSWVQITYWVSLEEEKFFSNTVMGYATVTEEEPKSATDPCYRLSIRRYLSWPSSGDGKINKDDPFYLVTEREKSPLSDIGGFDRRMLGSLIYIPALTKTEEQLRLGEETPFGVLIKQLVTSRIEATEQFQSIRDNLEALNAVGRRRRGVFREFSQKLNANLTDWEATAGLSLMLPKAEDLLKSSLQLTFSDLTVTDGKSMGLDQFGLGFQRTVINELIRMLAEGEDEDHGDPSPLKIVLYEEPEAFMHRKHPIALGC